MRVTSADLSRFLRIFLLFLSIPLWIFIIGPWILKIPTNFSYYADVVSTDNFYDIKESEFKGEQYSKSSFSYTIDSASGTLLTVRNTFKVETLDGKPVFQFSPLYAINAITHKHVPGYTDTKREGYLFAPPGITPDKTFTYWSANNIKPGIMSFKGEENLYGLKVYKFATNYGGEVDQTTGTATSGMPEYIGIKLNSTNEIWVEPTTGYLVKQQDYSTEYYYYNKQTGEKVSPYNKFLNTFSEDSVQKHVQNAKKIKFIYIIINRFVPILLFLVAGIYVLLQFGHLLNIKRIVIQNSIPLGILLVLYTLSYVAYASAINSVNGHVKEEFDIQSQNITNLIERRFDIYINALVGAKALLKSSKEVTRQEWKRYVDTLDIQKQYPGVQGIGFTKVIPKSEKQAFIQSVRKEGFLDFDIKPPGERDIYTSILHLEPFDDRNKRAFGYDMFTEQTRRSAMNRAKESGKPTASGKVTLVQEATTDIQPGFLVYIPYYADENTLEHSKKESITGYVYSPFRMYDLIKGIFGDRRFDLDFTIYDGLKTIDDSLLYKTTTDEKTHTSIKKLIYKRTMTIPIADHAWTVVFENKPNYRTEQIDRKFPLFVLFGGLSISSLITLLTYSMLRSKDAAEEYGRKLTKNLVKREEELESKNLDLEKFRLAVENASDQIVITDPKGIVLYINGSTSMITGFSQSEILGTKVGTLWGKLMDDQFYTILWKTISVEKKSFSGEIKNRRKNGDTYTAELHISPVLNDSGDVLFFVGIERDITKQKEIDVMKSSFISLASHQLRTPLTAVRWFTELLSEHTENLDEKQKELLQKISKSNERMIVLVNDLLNISRIESGRLSITPIKTDIRTLLNSVLDEINPTYGNCHRFTQTIDEDIKEILIDKGLTRHVYLNLLTNACKYSPKESEIEIKIFKKDHMIVSEIQDHGYGIPKDQQRHIFERFFRGENIVKIQTEGTGLGLYFAKLIIQAGGGTISFISTEGVGTTFQFTIPESGMIEHKGEISLE